MPVISVSFVFAGCGKRNETGKAGQQEEKTTKETVEGTENENLNSMEVRNNGEAIQWRADSQDNWHDLVKLSELKGADGRERRNQWAGRSKRDKRKNTGNSCKWKYVAVEVHRRIRLERSV